MTDASALIEFVGSCLADTVAETKPFQVRYSFQPYCPRLHYFAVTDPQPGHVEASMEAILESGHGLHVALQRRLAIRSVLAKLEGKSNFEFIGLLDESGNYIEFEFQNEGRPSGHCDGLVLWCGKYYTLEIKTIAADKLERLRLLPKPYRKNVVQAQCYSYEFTNLGYEIAGALIFYVERSRFEKYLGFVVPFEPDTGPNYVAMTVYGTASVAAGHLPEGICRSGVDAAYCPRRDQCFDAKNPVLFYDPGFRQLVDLVYPPESTHKKYEGLSKWKK